MHLSPALAPYKVAVLPLSKQLKEEAEELLYRFVKEFPATYDETGSIGKRYRRQDSIGTPFCVTVDFDSNEQKTYTLRNRDTMEQVRLTYEEIVDYINNAIRI
jgi:glycyl-tRNA synthetase